MRQLETSWDIEQKQNTPGQPYQGKNIIHHALGQLGFSKVRLSSRASLGNIVSIDTNIPASPSQVKIMIYKHQLFAFASGHPSFGYPLPLGSCNSLLAIINYRAVQLFASPWSVRPFFSSMRLGTWHSLSNILHQYLGANSETQVEFGAV